MTIHKTIALALGLLLLPVASHAALVTGSFTGTIDSGFDTTGVFGDPETDLGGAAITGSYVYDSSLFTQIVDPSTNNATGTGLGGLTVTLTIGGGSHIFSDATSSSIYLDTGASEITLQSANNPDANTSEIFYLDALDVLNPFVLSTDLLQSFSALSPAISSGTFTINNLGPDAVATGSFTVTSLAQEAIPEPYGIALFLTGLAGLSVGRKRRMAIA